MAQGKIIVETTQLDSTAAKVEGYAENYKTEYTRLYQIVQELRASYDGKDYEAFANQIEGFKNDFQKMETLMREYAAHLRKAATTYRDTQTELAGKAGGLCQGS